MNRPIAKESDKTSVPVSKPIVVTSRIPVAIKEPPNHTNRYTTIMDITEPRKQQQQPISSKHVSKEIEESLKNYFAYLNGKNSTSPNGASKLGTKQETKKYNTINPTNYALYEGKQVKERTKSPNTIEPVAIQKPASSDTTNKTKFATVNPNDLKKKINDAFLLLSETQRKQQQEDQLKIKNRRSKIVEECDLIQLADSIDNGALVDTALNSLVESMNKVEPKTLDKRQSIMITEPRYGKSWFNHDLINPFVIN